MKRIYIIATLICTLAGFSSCSDFFEEDSTCVIDANKNHLTNATDTIYSVTGILNKLQAIADRTILLGEVRGDLVDVTNATADDLRDVAMFNIDDDNMYNVPRDYYAIINNCNYFIAYADTAMKNNRNENIFKAEYAAVKAIRAWTYLQLVMNYGKVPFVTSPILTKEEAERTYPMMDIYGICDYFINNDGLQELVDQEYPNYGDIKSLPSTLFFVPVRLILGDMCLWTGKYMDAAKYYYGYINNRNGMNSSYPTSTDSYEWMTSDWQSTGDSYRRIFSQETNTRNGELITIIPMDSIPSEGYYSQMRNTFNTNSENEYKVSLVPSKSMIDLSAAQEYCFFDSKSLKFITAPKGIASDYSRGFYDGDLRLASICQQIENGIIYNGQRQDYQTVGKYATRNVHIYRRTLVYLRFAEAINRAGYPHFAYQVLASGVNTTILTDSICKYYSKEDSTMLVNTFNFPNSRYIVYTPLNTTQDANTQGIHSRGSGFTPGNEHYKMPNNPDITDPQEHLAWQQEQVENLIVDEGALEFVFEGYRFYDLMRVALRRNDPSFLAEKIYARKGIDNKAEMMGQLPDLTNKDNWYMKWNNQIGF